MSMLSNTVLTKYKFSSSPILNFYATVHKLPTQPCIYGSPSHDIICIHGYTAKSIELEVGDGVGGLWLLREAT